MPINLPRFYIKTSKSNISAYIVFLLVLTEWLNLTGFWLGVLSVSGLLITVLLSIYEREQKPIEPNQEPQTPPPPRVQSFVQRKDEQTPKRAQSQGKHRR